MSIKILRLPGEVTWKLSHGNWTSFLLRQNISLHIQIASSVSLKVAMKTHSVVPHSYMKQFGFI